MIEPIQIAEAITILEEIPTTGHNPLRVRCSDGRTYITKVTKGGVAFDFEIVSEFLCSIFLRLWNLNSPNFKAITIQPDLIQLSRLSQRHRPRLYQDNFCFGSEVVVGTVEMSPITDENSMWSINRLIDPLDYLKIGLFDLWVLNDDRKPTNPNLLQVSRGRRFDLYAIDHAYTFGTMSYDQLEATMQMSWNDSILVTSIGRRIVAESNPQEIANLAEYFQQTIESCHASFGEIVHVLENCYNLSVPGVINLEQFLFDSLRLKATFAGFLSRLKQ